MLFINIHCVFQEYHKGNKNIVLDDVNMKQQIYIYRCQNSTIQVKGKVNSIVLGQSVVLDLLYDLDLHL